MQCRHLVNVHAQSCLANRQLCNIFSCSYFVF